MHYPKVGPKRDYTRVHFEDRTRYLEHHSSVRCFVAANESHVLKNDDKDLVLNTIDDVVGLLEAIASLDSIGSDMGSNRSLEVLTSFVNYHVESLLERGHRDRGGSQ